MSIRLHEILVKLHKKDKLSWSKNEWGSGYCLSLSSGARATVINVLKVKRRVRGTFMETHVNVWNICDDLVTPKGWGEERYIDIPMFSATASHERRIDNAKDQIRTQAIKFLNKHGYEGPVELEFTTHRHGRNGFVVKSKPTKFDVSAPVRNRVEKIGFDLGLDTGIFSLGIYRGFSERLTLPVQEALLAQREALQNTYYSHLGRHITDRR